MGYSNVETTDRDGNEIIVELWDGYEIVLWDQPTTQESYQTTITYRGPRNTYVEVVID